MKNTKQLLVIASITAGISLTNKSVHAQQVVTNSTSKQTMYNCNMQYAKIIKPGDKGAMVKNIQSTLNLYFGAGLAEDGVYGDLTKEAVEKTQKKLCVKVDGIFGPQTAKSLLKYINNCSVDVNDGFSPVPADIQKKLICLGYNIKVTGNLYSCDTMSAIKDFQKKNGLNITGKVDMEVLNKINEKIKERADETINFKSNTDYYITVNSADHICKIYEKTNGSWKEIRSFDVLSGKINKGIYSLGLQGKALNFNGIEMNDFTQIEGLNVFYSAVTDTGYGLRISAEDAKFLNNIPKRTTIKIF